MDRDLDNKRSLNVKGRLFLAALSSAVLLSACRPNPDALVSDLAISNFCIRATEEKFRSHWPLVRALSVSDLQPGIDDLPNMNIALEYQSGQTSWVLYNPDVDDRNPNISQDKRKVVFERHGPVKKIAPHTFNNEVRDWTGIYAVNANGSDLHPVTKLPNPQTLDLDPIWSPDGNEIVFFRRDVSSLPSEGKLLRVKEDGSDLRVLFETSKDGIDASQYTFSPDSRRLAFRYQNESFVVNNDGTELKQISLDMGDFKQYEKESLIWTPNNRELIIGGYKLVGSAMESVFFLVDTNTFQSRNITNICPLGELPPDF